MRPPRNAELPVVPGNHGKVFQRKARSSILVCNRGAVEEHQRRGFNSTVTLDTGDASDLSEVSYSKFRMAWNPVSRASESRNRLRRSVVFINIFTMLMPLRWWKPSVVTLPQKTMTDPSFVTKFAATASHHWMPKPRAGAVVRARQPRQSCRRGPAYRPSVKNKNQRNSYLNSLVFVLRPKAGLAPPLKEVEKRAPKSATQFGHARYSSMTLKWKRLSFTFWSA